MLVTGAAGFLGSHLVAELLARGRRVVAVVRPRDGRSGLERLTALRDDFGWDGPGPPTGLEVVEGDVDQPWLGLERTTARRLAAGVAEIVHAAALVEFSERRRTELEATNGRALEHFAPLLADSDAGFTLVSTAYVAGVGTRTAIEEPAKEPPPPFRNAYEESKHLGERIARRRLSAAGVPWRFLRPSIVLGASGDGRTHRFDTIYRLLQLLDSLQGAAEERGESLRLRVRCRPESVLDLVPVDYVTSATAALVERPDARGVFHLTSADPLTLDELAQRLAPLFPLVRLEAVDEATWRGTPPDSRERLVDRALDSYRGYLDGGQGFDDRRTRAALRGTGLTCPPADSGWLTRLVDFARAVDWGRSRAPSRPPTGDLGFAQTFFDRFLAGRAGSELLAGAPRLTTRFEVRVVDLPGFRRVLDVEKGELRSVGPGGPPPRFRYDLESSVLRGVASGRLDPRDAFFARRAEIRGDVEEALRFAALMVDFFRRSPFSGAHGAS